MAVTAKWNHPIAFLLMFSHHQFTDLVVQQISIPIKIKLGRYFLGTKQDVFADERL
jgi:hypothetical protein